MSGLQIWLCLFTFRPVASKQLNGLTTIDKLSVDLVVQCQRIRFGCKGSLVKSPDPARVFMFDFMFCCCCCVFTFLSENTFFVAKVCNSLYTIYDRLLGYKDTDLASLNMTSIFPKFF